jgi:hypothetical protein
MNEHRLEHEDRVCDGECGQRWCNFAKALMGVPIYRRNIGTL